jgi:hypothetical protein
MIFFYLTPLVPLSLIGEGEVFEKGGEAPLGLPLRLDVHALDRITYYRWIDAL